MNLADWLKVYYKKDACKVRGTKAKVEHSILKWTGLLWKTREAYGLEVEACGFLLVDRGGREFDLDESTCAVCIGKDCNKCVFTKYLGHDCARYHLVWRLYNDAAPLLKALKRIKRRMEHE